MLVRPYVRARENLIEMGLLVLALFSYQAAAFLSASTTTNGTQATSVIDTILQVMTVVVKYILVLCFVIPAIVKLAGERCSCLRRLRCNCRTSSLGGGEGGEKGQRQPEQFLGDDIEDDDSHHRRRPSRHDHDHDHDHDDHDYRLNPQPIIRN
jgi:hypothetical protein